MGDDLDQRSGRFFHRFKRAVKIGCAGQNFVQGWFAIGFNRIAAIPISGPCHHLCTHMGQKYFCRALGMLRSVVNTAKPSLFGKTLGGNNHGVDRIAQFIAIMDQGFKPLFQAARTRRSLLLGPQQPAAQFLSFLPGQVG